MKIGTVEYSASKGQQTVNLSGKALAIGSVSVGVISIIATFITALIVDLPKATFNRDLKRNSLAYELTTKALSNPTDHTRRKV